jgi:hypothetical protein
MGTLIRHAGAAGPALPVFPFPVKMVQSPFVALLVTGVCAAPLLEACFGAAGRAAIALSTVAVAADPEYCAASTAATNPLSENHFAVSRHRCPKVGLDNGNRSWQVRNIFDVW